MRLLPFLIASSVQAQGDITVRLYDDRDGSSNELDDVDLLHFFDAASCLCGHDVRVRVEVGTLSGVSPDTNIAIRSGANCDSTEAHIRGACENLVNIDYSAIENSFEDLAFEISRITGACGNSETEMGVYVLVDENADGDDFVGKRTFPVDTRPPSPPLVDGDPAGGDSAVRVTWDPPKGDVLGEGGGYQVFCTHQGDAVFPEGTFEQEYATVGTECPSIYPAPVDLADLHPRFLCSDLVTGESARISPLQNGVEYEFHVIAVDAVGNPSALLDLGAGTAEDTDDFYTRYLRDGGKADGGFCALAGGRPGWGTALVVACGLLLLRRRATAIALGFLLATTSARAEENRYASPQHFAAEIKFGPYVPQVDEQFDNGRHPYYDVFGYDSSLLAQVEFDWQFLRTPAGSLGAGLLYGFFSETAAAIASDGTRSEADETSLRAHTLGALLVLRIDALWRYAHIPFVPYGKIGLDYYIWWVTEGDGSVANCPEDCPLSDSPDDDPQDIKARGGSMGWQASPGIALLLDVLDPHAAKLLDTEVGINHSYLFFELLLADVDNFGSADNPTLHLGDRTWTAGLAFEF